MPFDSLRRSVLVFWAIRAFGATFAFRVVAPTFFAVAPAFFAVAPTFRAVALAFRAVALGAVCFLVCPRLLAEPTDATPIRAKTADAKPSRPNSPAPLETTDDVQQERTHRPGWYLGRQIAPTMSASGAEWLTRNSREREEQPRKLLAALQLMPNQQVCDFGCGNGYYTLQLARQVGPRGKVFAVDIQQEMLTLLEQRAKPRGLNNIEPVLASLTDPKLPPRQLDWVLMVDVYHELSQPAVILQAIYASLNETGRIAIVEFREEDPEVPILPLHKMSQAQVTKEIRANGFKLVGQFDGLPWQHVLFFARQDSTVAEQKLTPWLAEKSNPSNPTDQVAIPRADP